MANKEMLNEMRETIRTHLAWRHNVSIERVADRAIDQILSLETDTCRIAVVRKEGELPQGVFDYKQHERIFLEAGYVQEVKSEAIIP